MPVAVRNKQTGPTVFSILNGEGHATLQLEWQGIGDPNGGDVQYVPDSAVKDVQFDKMIRRGVLEIIEEDAAESAMDKQAESYRERTEAASQAATATIDQKANNDLVQASCIGPSTRGTGECGEPVAVRESELKANERPILCPRHASLAPQYARVETDQMVEQGDSLVPVTKWVRTQVDRKTTAQ